MSDSLVSYAPSFESDEDKEEYIYLVNEAILDLEKIQEQLGWHMSTSFSEFERTKPTETFKTFKKLLDKYQKLSELDPDMDAEDFGIRRTAAMVVVDLQEVFELFQKGE